ncbi:MAG: SDR family NAD(P)-dependent oxidoreductase [Rhodobacteraceae bacterium]|nr:SDR family NAD(P)-dependent oxidoreductase [Paracoccaceae bacterium]
MTVKTAVVTGAGSGIGRAAALALDRAGFRLAVMGRRSQPLVETASQASRSDVLVLPLDVADDRAVADAFQAVLAHCGRLDVLFNNAGIGTTPVTIDELPVDEWNRCLATNVTGAFLCSRQAFGIMKSQNPRGGRIINNGSVSAHVPRPLTVPYTTTKHAITGLTRSLGLDGRPFDIACSQIDIGNAETDLTVRFRSGVVQPSGTVMAEPVFGVAHCGDAVAYIASLPLDTNIPFLTIMASQMPYLGRG